MLRRRADYEYAKGLVEAFFTILTQGCGNASCSNVHCKSNPSSDRLTASEAAAKAIILAIEAPMTICLVPSMQLHIEMVPETDEDEAPVAIVAPSTPRQRLTTAVRLDESINSPKRTPQKRKQVVFRQQPNHEEAALK